MNLINEEQNWYTFACKLNSYLIDKGYKMEYSNNCRQYCLDDVPHFIINYDEQFIHFTQDLYSMWYRMRFDDDLSNGDYAPDFELLARFADEMLIEYKQRIYVNKLLRIQNDF